jgi:hypothetical protein
VQGGHHERGTVDADKIAFVVIDVPQATETLDADVARFTDGAGLDYEIVTIPPGTANITSQMQEVAASGADVVQVVGTPRGCRARLGVTRPAGQLPSHTVSRSRRLYATSTTCSSGDYATLDSGAVAERTNALALKASDPEGSVGSNPTRSAHQVGTVPPRSGTYPLTRAYRSPSFASSSHDPAP